MKTLQEQVCLPPARSAQSMRDGLRPFFDSSLDRQVSISTYARIVWNRRWAAIPIAQLSFWSEALWVAAAAATLTTFMKGALAPEALRLINRPLLHRLLTRQRKSRLRRHRAHQTPRHIFAHRRPMLKSVSRSAANHPNILMLRMPVHQKISI